MLEISKGPYSLIPSEHKWKILKDPSQAYLYKKNRKINLLNGEESDFEVRELFKVLDLEIKSNKRILHLSYEAGYLNTNNENLINEQDWLAIDLHYENSEFLAPLQKNDIKLLNNSQPSIEEYKKAFDLGYQGLELGDSYQFNLTFPFTYSYEGDFNDIAASLFRKKESLGAYAHGTYIPSMKWGILSNSPECLFNKNKNFIETKPIKGTIRDEEGAWKKLSQNEKDEAELFMITDLLKNDLNRLEPRAKVKMLKAPLKVPGLLHQFSHLTLESTRDLSLEEVSCSLFPGGSITGAPKKRTMEILREIESSSRGAYCGSTFFFDDEQTKVSINIRTAEVDDLKKELTLGAGGGITLLSKVDEEYKEMLSKVDSFALLLQPPYPSKIL